MGVPALFRWLTNKNSRLTSQVVEEQPQVINGIEMPIDTSQRNPNDIEFDNLYLDMNGIIHPCAHPEDKVCGRARIERALLTSLKRAAGARDRG